MTFFYDLNKRLADLAVKQDLNESKVAESEKWIQKAVNPAHKGGLHKALHVAQDKTIPKAKIEKATHSKNPKLRHMAQFAKNVANEGHCPACDCSPCKCNEGNEFSGNRANAIAAHKSEFEVDGKKYKVTDADPIGLEEKKAKPDYIDLDGDGDRKETMKKAAADKKRSAGTAFDPEVAKSMFANKDEHPRHDVKDTGYSKRYTRKHEDDLEKDNDEVSTEPKRKGRPKGKEKGPERTTKGAWKHKGERKVKEGDMEGSHDRDEAGEYGAEGDYVKNELHTMVRVARDLERHLRDNEDLPTWCIGKLSQAKGMVVSVMDYIMSEKERGIEAATGKEGITLEKAPPGARAERMVKGIKKSLSKDGHLSDKDKAIAYATTWKAHNQGKVEEESTVEKDDKAERAAKKVTKDIEYDEHHKGKDDNRAEKAGKKVTKDIEYDDKKDKEEKVEETTVAGSVATATTSGKSSKGSMQFGKGVYESINASVEKMISESISIESKMEESSEGMEPTLTIQADGEEAAKLMMLLKLAGLENQVPATCPTCNATPCGCAEVVDENKPDWPTNPEVTGDNDPYLRRLSGGLNGPKSTGQTTVPVIAGQRQRTSTMEENVELERSLFKTWKNYKG